MAEITNKKARKRIGVHLSTAGGCWKAVERAVECGANTFQIFSASPRMWKANPVKPEDAAKMKAARAEHNVGPLCIHASYLINVCAQSEEVRRNSVAAFRGEVERALALGAEFLVLHPGSWRGMTRDEGITLAARSIEEAIAGLVWQGTDFKILIENTAGAEFSLGGSFEQVAEMVARLKTCAPVGVCLDTCHVHVAGYDLVSEAGYAETMQLIESTIGFDDVRVWHCNDAKAERGSKLDRHQHIGEGTMGAQTFRRLLHDARWAHCAFIAETPVDAPGDEQRNVSVLRTLAAG
ncbi:MAG TPA: deoxyribonuclease IV [Acidobacteriaceae bacterium]